MWPGSLHDCPLTLFLPQPAGANCERKTPTSNSELRTLNPEPRGLGIRGLAAAAAANQIDGGAEFEERIIRRVDPVDTWYGIEDNFLLVVCVVRDRGGEDNLAELDQRSIRRPVIGRVVYDITVVSDLYEKLEADGTLDDSVREFVVQEVRVLGLCCGVIQMIVSGFRNDSVTPVLRNILFAGELQRVYAEVRFACEAGWAGFRRLYKLERFRVCAEELFDRCRRRFGGIGCGDSMQKLQEFLTGSGRKSVRRMADDIGVHVFCEIKSDGESAGIRVWIGVRY
jgi:hypothetical protein